MAIPFVTQLLVAFLFNVLAYLIAPKPKAPKPDIARDFEDPTADAGRPIPWVLGTITVKGGNILFSGDKGRRDYQIKAGK